MELTSKQRAQLRGMAATMDTILHVGKDGISDNLIKQADDALEARDSTTFCRENTSTTSRRQKILSRSLSNPEAQIFML